MARHKEDLNHLEWGQVLVMGKLAKSEKLLVPHLVEWFDHREVSFNCKRDGQVDTASHGALEEMM